MSNEAIAAYLDTMDELQQSTAAVEALVDAFLDASVKLRNWRECSFVNVGNIAVAGGRGGTIDGNQLPTAAQLAAAIATWHAKHQAAVQAWESVPEHRRTGLQPPDHSQSSSESE
ncbi:MAG: hypothetical protein HY261_00185 [Chloroflexi bacterium]|nr:hypothetical protein [Chloroflexota bacterium]